MDKSSGANAAAVAGAGSIDAPQLPHVTYIECECGCGTVFRDDEGIRVEAIAGKYFRECGEKRLAALEIDQVRR
jgi:hypothetical protein